MRRKEHQNTPRHRFSYTCYRTCQIINHLFIIFILVSEVEMSLVDSLPHNAYKDLVVLNDMGVLQL